MTVALNYCSKAIEALSSYEPPVQRTRLGMQYLADKLRQAVPFVLPDYGTLLDRSKALPEIDGLSLRPPFPVTALEYTATGPGRTGDFYTAARCSKRIALAWDWQNDLPMNTRLPLAPGVVIASIAYYDDPGIWMPICGALHYAYDDEWQSNLSPSPFRSHLIATGGISPAQARARAYPGTLVAMLPDVWEASVLAAGGPDAAQDIVGADLADEVAAYFETCCALACKNVSAERQTQPEKLNRARIKSGKLPLKDFHVLKLGEADFGEARAGGAGGMRSHLRRGHIRRLGSGRITWVNQTMVHGSRGGFVDKVYAVGGRRP